MKMQLDVADSTAARGADQLPRRGTTMVCILVWMSGQILDQATSPETPSGYARIPFQ